MNTDRNHMIEEIKSCLQAINPAKVILFGSHAEGSADADSDIDLVVILNKDTKATSFKEKLQETVAVRKLLANINKRIALDVLVYSKPEWQSLLNSRSSFSREIIKKGITLQ